MPTSDPLSFGLLAFTSLLAIVDPLAAVPIYLSITHGYDQTHRRATLRLAVLTAIGVLVLFAALGTGILRFFGVTTEAFRIAGGILFIGVGLDMLQARRQRGGTTESEQAEAESQSEVGIIPLGLPTLAGPGAITSVITLNAQASTAWHRVSIYAAIVLVMLVAWVLLAVAPALFRRLGRTGLNVITRLMGLIVMVVGVQFVIDGVVTVAARIMRGS